MMKLILENWNKYIKEAIVDVPAEKLSDIFDDNGVINEKVVSVIEDAKNKIEKFLQTNYKGFQVTEMFIVGAAVTYQFSPISDIDISVVIPQMTKERKPINEWMETNLIYNNWSVAGSKRPFQFKPLSSNGNYANADAAYDPFTKKWLKKPDFQKAKQEYEKIISDPQSNERQLYIKYEKMIQPSLQRLYSALESDKLQESISNELQNLFKSAFKRYEILKTKRSSSYEQAPEKTGLISQNWGTGNVLYKFLDREGYNEVYEYIKKAIKSNFEIVDQNYLNTLKQMLQKVLASEHGYSVSESKKSPRVIRKLF